ncbi:hypothetical protein COU54_04680 [Candidatus Pacearchaeota archaeon CG10_big_fil_rev_8_21_14_0_10_31_24]|nr:MAG: hypothetical protein COU54_04680 [Candidatus Pacearchaeota archaeon CG10_big_fil_rev_8_21_14_0_10_31_24]
MQFLRRKLKNGMNVIMEKRELDVVSFSIANRFGGAYEDSEVKGIAHFMEHLVFTGTESRSHEDLSREIEKKGGIMNAFTADEVTSFWFKLPSEHVFSGIDIICDLLLHPIFDVEKFEKEKKVILEEIKMYHDDPRRNVHEKIVENMFEKPFGEGVIGSEKTIRALKRDFVAEYFKKNYSPENYVVSIVGNADFDKICEYLESKFAAEGRKTEVKTIIKKNGESVEEREGIDQAHFVFGVHAPLMNDKNHVVLDVLDAYLASGMSSRLFLKIREEKGLAYAVKSDVSVETNYSYYTIYVGTTKEAIPEVKKIILEEFSKIDEMNEKDLEESKNRLIGLKRVSSEESSGVMISLLITELAVGAEKYYDYEKEVEKVSLSEVKDLAKELIKSYSSAAIVPK